MDLPKKHLCQPKLAPGERKHFEDWSRAELIAHLLRAQADIEAVLSAGASVVSANATYDAYRKTYPWRSTGEIEPVHTNTWVSWAGAGRLGLFQRCTQLELERDEAREALQAAKKAEPGVYSAPEGLGLQALASNIDNAIEQAAFVLERLRGYSKRIKEKL